MGILTTHAGKRGPSDPRERRCSGHPDSGGQRCEKLNCWWTKHTQHGGSCAPPWIAGHRLWDQLRASAWKAVRGKSDGGRKQPQRRFSSQSGQSVIRIASRRLIPAAQNPPLGASPPLAVRFLSLRGAIAFSRPSRGSSVWFDLSGPACAATSGRLGVPRDLP